jgi:3-methyladenine DNA glycosylase AlkD
VIDIDGAIAHASSALAGRADPERASGMARYLKTSQPCHGVRRPEVRRIARGMKRLWEPTTRAEYGALVEALWALPHREERYLAIDTARLHARFIEPRSVPLYRRMITEGAWWDLVDEIASKLVGGALLTHRSELTPTIRSWIGDTDLWIRRSAIICQIGHRADTDTELLYEACLRCADDPDFFIRKAIGWALRAHTRVDPDGVAAFVSDRETSLSPLSRREALKHV